MILADLEEATARAESDAAIVLTVDEARDILDAVTEEHQRSDALRTENRRLRGKIARLTRELLVARPRSAQILAERRAARRTDAPCT